MNDMLVLSQFAGFDEFYEILCGKSPALNALNTSRTLRLRSAFGSVLFIAVSNPPRYLITAGISAQCQL